MFNSRYYFKIFTMMLIQALLLSSFTAYSEDVTYQMDNDGKVIGSLSNEYKKEVEKSWWEEAGKKQASLSTFSLQDKAACNQLRKYLKAIGEDKLSKQADLCSVKNNKDSISIITVYDKNSPKNLEKAREQIKFAKLQRHLKRINAKRKPKEVDGSEGVYLGDLLPETERERNLAIDTMQMGVIGGAVIAALAAMPKDFTNWDEDVRPWSHYATQTPVLDKDNYFINYVAHPYAGATYYLIARHNGFNRWESLGYSIFMSTFFWEYGLEAFYEIPSLTDLWVTPLLGSLLGLIFELAIDYIKENDGKLLGSEILGGVAMFIMDPLSPILSQFRGVAKYLDDHDFKMRLYLGDNLSREHSLYPYPRYDLDHGNEQGRNRGQGPGVGLKFEMIY